MGLGGFVGPSASRGGSIWRPPPLRLRGLSPLGWWAVRRELNPARRLRRGPGSLGAPAVARLRFTWWRWSSFRG